jgi:hypothetical protein
MRSTRVLVTSLTICLVGVFAAINAWAGFHGHSSASSPSPDVPHATNVTKSQPSIYLWVWERPEDLRFLKNQNIGVAFLAETIQIVPPSASNDKSGVLVLPRRQPLHVNDATPLVAVVRVETPHDLWHEPAQPPSAAGTTVVRYTPAQRQRIAEMIAATAALPRVSAVQIDFDASQSERSFYAALLHDVRQQLPQNTPLSITALASWCIGDPWLDQLPPNTIDEAVPMLFRMGPDASNVASYMKAGTEFHAPACRTSLGLSTDEKFSQGILDGTIQTRARDNDAKRIYVFSDRAWREDEAEALIKEVQK